MLLRDTPWPNEPRRRNIHSARLDKSIVTCVHISSSTSKPALRSLATGCADWRRTWNCAQAVYRLMPPFSNLNIDWFSSGGGGLARLLRLLRQSLISSRHLASACVTRHARAGEESDRASVRRDAMCCCHSESLFFVAEIEAF